MEGTPLRSLPARLPSPVNPVHALAQVEATLPDLPSQAQRALALVDIGGRPRAEAATELGLPEAELSKLLASGRKALRRMLAPLPSGGWCERAERLISDRLDGALAPSGRTRLEAHMGSCQRCATHERKLIQAHDLLVESYLAQHAPAAPRAVAAAAPAAELRAVGDPAAAPTGGRTLPLAWPAAFMVALLLVVVIAALALAGILHAP
jgi:Putative zinc-finger